MIFDKKLVVYLLILAALVTSTFFSVQSSKQAESTLTASEMELLEDTGHFEKESSLESNEVKLMPLYDEKKTLTPKELGNGETPSAELLAAYQKFLGEKPGGNPIVTFGLFIITGVFTGFLVVTYVLPYFVQQASEEVYGSSERVGAPSTLMQAQAAVAQGEWEQAMAHYEQAAREEPENRLPWVEIAMLKRERLEDPPAALRTLDEALARGGWRENDEAFFLFRKFEIFETDLAQHEQAVAMLRHIMERFPQSRHSANAKHKLHEMGEE